MNIGVFGGTFNPPHIGHLIVAERVREEYQLDKILFIPSATSPHKQHIEIVDPAFRMEMVRLAVLEEPLFEASDIEIARGGVSYTVDTLTQLKAQHPTATLWLLIGMDNAPDFATWKSPEKIIELARVVIMTRPGVQPHSIPEQLQDRFIRCTVPEIGVSSSEIRERVKVGKSIRYLVPKAVESYIRYRRLYL